jgi:zinc protease
MKTLRALLFVTCLAFATACATAEDTPSPLETLKQSNARLHRFVLDNGMVCLVKEDHSAPVAAVQIWVGSGAVNEGEFLGAGLSHFVEHMIFKGTPTRPVGEITRQINDAGGEINAYTAQDRTVFHASLPGRNWKVGFDVLADAVMHATFPKNEWARERDVILREFAMGKDSPDREIYKLMSSTAYRVHPYRIPVIGYEDVFKSSTRDDLVKYFHQNYTPDNMIVVVVGDVNAADVEARVRETFKSFTRKAGEMTPLPAEPPQVAPRFARETGAYNVSRLLWGYHTVALSDPDAAALDVLANIVGSGRSSRLVKKIKEEKKLVQEIDAWSMTAKDPGLFGFGATFDPTNEAAVVAAVQKEVDGWAAGGFSDEELEKAKRAVLVGELGSLQTMDGQAYSYGSGEFYAADPSFSEQYLENVQAVDSGKLKDVAKRYLSSANRTLVVLSPEGSAATASPAQPAAEGTDVQKMTTAGGSPLIVREDHRLPFVYFCAALKSGLLTETSTNNGITTLMSDLLTRGTAAHSAQEIAQTVERLGGSLSPFCGRNSFGLQASCLSQDADTFMSLFSDCLLNSTFPAEETEKQKLVQLSAIQQQREQPFFAAEEALRQALFPNHPYRWTPQGSRETVQGLSRDALAGHFKQQFVKTNLVLAIFGDITKGQARKLAERYLSEVPDGPAPRFQSAQPNPSLPCRSKRREPKEQTILLVGYPGVDLKDPRVDALSVIENALSGLSSDLSTAVREKRGLVYYVGATDRPGLEPGLFALYAGTREETAGQVEKLIDAETARMAKKGLRDDEIERAKKQILAAQDMSLQDNGALAQTCALNELYGLGYDYNFKFEERMKAVTPDRVREAAASIFQPDRRAVSLVLPGRSETEKKGTP